MCLDSKIHVLCTCTYPRYGRPQACPRNPLPSGFLGQVQPPCLRLERSTPAGRLPRCGTGSQRGSVFPASGYIGRSVFLFFCLASVWGMSAAPETVQESREAGFPPQAFVGMVSAKLAVPGFSSCHTGQVASPRMRKMPAGPLGTIDRRAFW